MRLLIVDDETDFIKPLEERLGLRGIDAVGTTSAAEALARVCDEIFDVVLLDVKMPGMSGLELLSRIRKLKPEQKVLLLTGHGSVQDADEGKRLGADDYLMKPVDLETLLNVIRRAVPREER